MKMATPFISPTLSSALDSLFSQSQRIDNRPSWDVYFLAMAKLVATRATCPRASVGCVLVRDGHGLVSGYNGAAKGLPHCLDVGCMMHGGHCIRSCHAEQNAITTAARFGVAIEGATCYVTHQPCTTCANMLINVGVIRIVYINEYAPADKGEFFRMVGVQMERIELP